MPRGLAAGTAPWTNVGATRTGQERESGVFVCQLLVLRAKVLLNTSMHANVCMHLSFQPSSVLMEDERQSI